MSTLRADTITNSAGTGAPSLSHGLRTTSILDTSGGNTVTINGILPISAAEATGMTLLGTLATTSGAVQTLSGLTLTGYKQVVAELDGVSHVSGSSQTFAFGPSTYSIASGFNTAATSGDIVSGMIWVSLDSGIGTALTCQGAALPLSINTRSQIFASGLSTASTSISITVSGGSFDAGLVRIYGVK